MLNPIEMERYILAIAKRANLRVVWEDNCPTPRTDGKTIWLPKMGSNITKEAYDMMRHYVVHEVDHVLHTDYKAWQRGEPSTKTMKGAVLNCLEDVRIEMKGAREYLGDAINSNGVVAKRLDEIADLIKETSKQPMHPNYKKHKRASPLLAFAAEQWSDIYPSVAAVVSKLRDTCRAFPGAEDKLKLLDKGPYADALKNAKDTDDIVALTEKLMREVFTDPEDKEDEGQGKSKKQKKDGDKSQGKGKKGKGKKQEKSDEEDEQEQGGNKDAEAEEGTKGDASEEGDSEADGDQSDTEGEACDTDKFIEVDYSDLMPDPHTTLGHARKGMHIRYNEKDYTGGEYRPAVEEDRKVFYPKNGPLGDSDTGSSSTQRLYEEQQLLERMNATIARTNPNFAHQVRTILQVRAKARMQYGQKRGRLHQAALHRLLTEEDHNKDKIFKRKQITNVLDSCVFLLVDQSGSMSGQKYSHAAVAAAMMSEVIGNVLNIPVMIASFTDYLKQQLYVHREWHDKMVSQDRLLESFARSGAHCMAGNADGDAIMWAYDNIIRQKQRRKLLIVFSDGSPAGGGRGNVAAYTREIIRGIEQETPVNIVGIGIQDHNVEWLYKENHVVSKIEELERALLKCIEGKLK